MFRPLARSHRRPHRRGTSILLIALIMLTLFTVVGIAYLYFAMIEARLASARKAAAGGGGATSAVDPDPTDTVNRFFAALIYDVGDDGLDLQNSLRGHSIGRSLYGSMLFNTTPGNGVGTFHETTPFGPRAQLINYTAIGGGPFLLDPEWNNSRPLTPNQPVPGFLTSQAGRAYVSKAAPYSYSDVKNLFQATANPITGEVVTQSFHRDWIFRHSTQPVGQSALHPSNPNWTNLEGRYRTLRPRPVDHPGFPYPSDATGDVKNLEGAPGGNDSIWIDIGAPVLTAPDGRRYKMLIAPLILPLDGKINLSAHGNVSTPTTGAHASHQGWGPWEVNIAHVISVEAERQALINARGARIARNGTASRPFDPYTANQPLQLASAVAWGGNGAGFTMPAGNSLAGRPSYGPGFDATNAPVNFPNHPSLPNPNEWPTTPLSATQLARRFALGDIKRMNMRHAFLPDWHRTAEIAQIAPQSLQGNPTAFPFVVAPRANDIARYRLDPVHGFRKGLTTHSMTLDRPGLVPNFPSRDITNALALLPTGKPGALLAAPYPAPGAVGAVSDFAAADRWVNAKAALGSVNVNRSLPDYRNDLTLPLSAPGNVTVASAAIAEADRQALARDIFIRLCAALGAAAYIDTDATGAVRITLPQPNSVPPYTLAIPPPVGGTVPYNQTQYDALRYLAQLSVNIVDYIDNDDVMTPFAWNTTGDVVNDYADVGNRFVFGVELPRLQINEVFSQLVNDPRDDVAGDGVTPPAQPGQARFWMELLNRSTTPYAAGPAGPLGDGSVPLSAYQIQIARANRLTGVPVMQQGDMATYLGNPANTTGVFNPALGAPDIVFTFPAVPVPPAPGAVGPNNGTYAPPAATLPPNGIVLVGPPAPVKMNSDEFHQPTPLPAGSVWGNKVESPQMMYTFQLPAPATLVTPEFGRNVCLLRRAANPYLAPSPTNVHVTVDAMDFVPSWDTVHRAMGQTMNRGPYDATTNPTGYDPVPNQFSVGKVQPYAGHANATVRAAAGQVNQYTFPNSMVLDQRTVATAPNAERAPKNTFGRHNGLAGLPAGSTFVPGTPASLLGGETVMTPYDWLVHLDRPLTSPIELLQVSDCKPHQLANQFLRASAAAPGVTYSTHRALWFDEDLAPGLARGLEMLAIKPHIHGVPHGGRLPKINVNVLEDQRVVRGLLDAQPSNGFNQAWVDSNVWGGLIGSRTVMQSRNLPDNSTVQVPVPAQTTHDTNTPAGDRPIMSFGGPAALPGSTFAFGGGGNIDQTLLRRNPPGTGQPFLDIGGPAAHSYLRNEALRKMFNNTASMSYTYAVYITIGFFEVTSVTTPPGWFTNVGPDVRLGAELFNHIPGDKRQKVFAIIDMTNMALDPTGTAAATAPPFFTSLEATARPTAGVAQLSIAYSRYDATANRLFVTSDGQEVEILPIVPGGPPNLVLGYGLEAQAVSVTRIVGPGVIEVAGMTRTAWGGSCVSNVRPGYPGAQPGFNYTAAGYRSLVPHYERVR